MTAPMTVLNSMPSGEIKKMLVDLVNASGMRTEFYGSIDKMHSWKSDVTIADVMSKAVKASVTNREDFDIQIPLSIGFIEVRLMVSRKPATDRYSYFDITWWVGDLGRYNTVLHGNRVSRSFTIQEKDADNIDKLNVKIAKKMAAFIEAINNAMQSTIMANRFGQSPHGHEYRVNYIATALNKLKTANSTVYADWSSRGLDVSPLADFNAKIDEMFKSLNDAIIANGDANSIPVKLNYW